MDGLDAGERLQALFDLFAVGDEEGGDDAAGEAVGAGADGGDVAGEFAVAQGGGVVESVDAGEGGAGAGGFLLEGEVGGPSPGIGRVRDRLRPGRG